MRACRSWSQRLLHRAPATAEDTDTDKEDDDPTKIVQAKSEPEVGMAGGPVLLFSNPRGPSGITGSPVNVASKLSEDAGIPGRINIAGSLAAELRGLGGADPFAVDVGGVVLSGFTL